jgi:hypothetical protein
MKKSELLQLFEIDDLNKLPVAVETLLFSDQLHRDDIYKKLIKMNNGDMSYDWFQALYEQELAERKQKKQDFTPGSLSNLCSFIIKDNGSIHEPTAGNGSMIIAAWWKRCSGKMPWEIFPSNSIVCAWELSSRSIPLLLLNLSIRGIMGYVYHGDVLENNVIQKYILLNKKDDALAFSEIIKVNNNAKIIKDE